MERICTREEAEFVLRQYRQIRQSIDELEGLIPERHFTMDGHLVGSIGEVLASYHYGIVLYDSSHKEHDGVVDGIEVQIKATQRDKVLISGRPEHLLVLYLSKQGEVFEVYNGPGKTALRAASNPDSHGYCHIQVSKLVELNQRSPKRIPAAVPLPKLQAQ